MEYRAEFCFENPCSGFWDDCLGFRVYCWRFGPTCLGLWGLKGFTRRNATPPIVQICGTSGNRNLILPHMDTSFLGVSRIEVNILYRDSIGIIFPIYPTNNQYATVPRLTAVCTVLL